MAVPPYLTARVDVLRIPDGETDDVVAVEEPLEIRIDGRPVAVTMRTPGHDEELALGFALSEGLRATVPGSRTTSPRTRSSSTLRVRRRPARAQLLHVVFLRRLRQGRARSGLRRGGARHRRPAGRRRACSPGCPTRLRVEQAAFAITGGLHATGLFAADGALLCLREDVGRHNALDKVVGWAYRQGLLPLSRHVLCVSGRLSFELVQKAAVAGCPVLVAVGAPSSLAVELARDRGITLCGFVRNGRLNVYSEPWRVVP